MAENTRSTLDRLKAKNNFRNKNKPNEKRNIVKAPVSQIS